MAIRPHIGGRLSVPEAEAALEGLVAVDVRQLRAGLPSPSALLLAGRIRYTADDPTEEWLPLSEIIRRGAGDCEDLAAAVAAERRLEGIPARVKLVHLYGGNWHAVVEHTATGRLEDPSQTGGYVPPKRR